MPISISLAFRADSTLLMLFLWGLLILLLIWVCFIFSTWGYLFLFFHQGGEKQCCLRVVFRDIQYNQLESGLEPTTFWSQVQCSNQCTTARMQIWFILYRLFILIWKIRKFCVKVLSWNVKNFLFFPDKVLHIVKERKKMQTTVCVTYTVIDALNDWTWF